MNSHTSRWRFGASLIAGAVALSSAVALVSTAGATSTTRANGPIYYIAPGMPAAMKAVTEDGTAVADVPVGLRGFLPKVLSPDGTKVAWGEMNGSLKVANPDGTSAITLATAQSANWSGLQFSPDSTTVYVTGMGQLNKLYGFDTSTANQVPASKVILDPGSNDMVTSFSISTTGKIAYIVSSSGNDCPSQSGRGVYVRDLSGSGAGTLLPNSCADLSGGEFSVPTNVAWSVDGTKLYVVQEIVERPQGGSQINATIIEQFTESGIVAGGPLFDTGTTERQIYNLRMSPDGKKLAYIIIPAPGTTAGSTDGLYVLDIASKTARQLAVIDMPSSVTWGSVAGVASTPTTTAPTAPNTTSTPGVTVTDPTVYTTAPKQVASGSSITVLSPTQIKTQTLETTTPDVCLPTKEDIVFIEEGRCTVNVLNKKSGEVLRRLRTTVVEDDIVELGVGNEVAILAPIYFDNGSSDLNKKARSRIRGLKDQISAAGTVMVVGHSGIMLGDTPENRALSRARAESTVREMKRIRAAGPFYSVGVGAVDPAVNDASRSAQGKNRRVIIVLVP